MEREKKMPVEDIEKCSDYMDRILSSLPSPLTHPEWVILAKDSIAAVEKHLIRAGRGEKLEEKFSTLLTNEMVYITLAKWMQSVYNQGRVDYAETISQKAKNFIMSSLF